MQIARLKAGSSGLKYLFIYAASLERTYQQQSFPRPNPHRRCGQILHMFWHVKVGVCGCVWEMVCAVKIKLSNCVLRSGNGAGAAKVCPKDPVGNLCLWKGGRGDQ